MKYLVAVMIVIGLLFAVNPAYAEGPPEEGDPESEFPATVVWNAQAGDDQDVLADHASCEIETQYPHNSRHREERINVVAEIQCTTTLQVIEMRTQLYKMQCIWFICVTASSVADSGWQSRVLTSYMDQNANTPCAPGKYYGRSVGRVIWEDLTVGNLAHKSATVNITCSN